MSVAGAAAHHGVENARRNHGRRLAQSFRPVQPDAITSSPDHGLSLRRARVQLQAESSLYFAKCPNFTSADGFRPIEAGTLEGPFGAPVSSANDLPARVMPRDGVEFVRRSRAQRRVQQRAARSRPHDRPWRAGERCAGRAAGMHRHKPICDRLGRRRRPAHQQSASLGLPVLTRPLQQIESLRTIFMDVSRTQSSSSASSSSASSSSSLARTDASRTQDAGGSTPAPPASAVPASALLTPLRDLSMMSRPTRSAAGTPAPRATLPHASGSRLGVTGKRAGGALVKAVRDKRGTWSLLEPDLTGLSESRCDWLMRTRMDICEACHALFTHRASLPRFEAIRLISDRELEDTYVWLTTHIRDEMSRLTLINHESRVRPLNDVVTLLWRHLPTIRNTGELLDEQMLAGLRDHVAAIMEHRPAFIEQWSANAFPGIKLFDIEASLEANLPNLPLQDKAAVECNRRLSAALIAPCRLQIMRALADSETINFAVRARFLDGPGSEKLLGENGLVALMETFGNDIWLASESIRDELLAWDWGPAVADSALIVLDGLVARLTEFAAGLDAWLDEARHDPDLATLPLDSCKPLVEIAWLVANDALRLLGFLRPPHASPAPEEDVVSAAVEPRTVAPAPASASSSPRSGKGKGKKKAKGKPARSAAASQSERSEPREPSGPAQTQAPRSSREAPTSSASAASAAASALQTGPETPATDGLARTELGTYMLVKAGQAQAAVPSAAPSAAPVRAGPPTPDELAELLARVDRLLAFDLSAEQRNVSQARRSLSPENAEYVTGNVIERLTRQAVDMRACLDVLDVPRQRWGLTAAQADDVHGKIEQLRSMQAQAEGVSRSLREQLHADTLDHVKRYPFPTQRHVERLLAEGALAPAGTVTPLDGEPGTLFELKLQPSPLRNGSMPRPIWLHVHTKRPVRARELATLRDATFVATHVKSDEQRGYNRDWEDARAREGHENVVVHRGKLTAALCRRLLAQ